MKTLMFIAVLVFAIEADFLHGVWVCHNEVPIMPCVLDKMVGR